MYKLYTTYAANIKKIPNNTRKVMIMRFPLAIKDKDLILIPELAPNANILLDYKGTGDWDEYKKQFLNQMKTDKKMQDYLLQIEECLQEYNDICLICCEKDYTHCHRSILEQYFEDLGYYWEELKK